MASYQGRALQHERQPRQGTGRLARIAQVLGALVLLVAMVHVPWSDLRRQHAIVTDVRVHGAHYLDASRIAAIAGVKDGDDLMRVDLDRCRQALLMNSRIAAAAVHHGFLRTLRIDVIEREPVLLVLHGVPWEIDSCGVLLEPLERGVVADVPLLVGPSYGDVPAGAHVSGPEVKRGIDWMRALSARDLQLSGQVSEIDVSDPLRTSLTLMSGTRVVAPTWPPAPQCLAMLRVVLADLGQKHIRADEVDVRFRGQVIVRPADVPEAATVAHTG